MSKNTIKIILSIKYIFGLKDTMEAIENGMVDVLIIWENIDFVRLTMKNKDLFLREFDFQNKKVVL